MNAAGLRGETPLGKLFHKIFNFKPQVVNLCHDIENLELTEDACATMGNTKLKKFEKFINNEKK